MPTFLCQTCCLYLNADNSVLDGMSLYSPSNVPDPNRATKVHLRVLLFMLNTLILLLPTWILVLNYHLASFLFLQSHDFFVFVEINQKPIFHLFPVNRKTGYFPYGFSTSPTVCIFKFLNPTLLAIFKNSSLLKP